MAERPDSNKAPSPEESNDSSSESAVDSDDLYKATEIRMQEALVPRYGMQRASAIIYDEDIGLLGNSNKEKIGRLLADYDYLIEEAEAVLGILEGDR